MDNKEKTLIMGLHDYCQENKLGFAYCTTPFGYKFRVTKDNYRVEHSVTILEIVSVAHEVLLKLTIQKIQEAFYEINN